VEGSTKLYAKSLHSAKIDVDEVVVPQAVEFNAAKIDDNNTKLSQRSSLQFLTIQRRNHFRVGFGLSPSDITNKIQSPFQVFSKGDQRF
jgi:hypothetical protein